MWTSQQATAPCILPLEQKKNGWQVGGEEKTNMGEKYAKNSMKIGGMPPEMLEGNESSSNQNLLGYVSFSRRVSFCFLMTTASSLQVAQKTNRWHLKFPNKWLAALATAAAKRKRSALGFGVSLRFQDDGWNPKSWRFGSDDFSDFQTKVMFWVQSVNFQWCIRLSYFCGRTHRLVTGHIVLEGGPCSSLPMILWKVGFLEHGSKIPSILHPQILPSPNLKLEPLPKLTRKNIASVPSNPKESFPTLAWHSQPGGKELIGC